MQPINYKNILYISSSNSWNDLCVTKNYLYTLLNNKTNILWKSKKFINDLEDSVLDKKISNLKNRLLSYNQVVLDSHPNKWESLASEYKVDNRNKILIGKPSCLLSEIDDELISLINGSIVKSLLMPDEESGKLVKALGVNKEILIGQVLYNNYDYQFYSINYFLSIGELIINKKINDIYINNFDIYCIFEPDPNYLSSLVEAFFQEFDCYDEKLLLIINADASIIKQKTTKSFDDPPILLINNFLSPDHLKSICKMSQVYFQSGKKYLLNYPDLEINNLNKKTFVPYSKEFDFLKFFKDDSTKYQASQIIKSKDDQLIKIQNNVAKTQQHPQKPLKGDRFVEFSIDGAIKYIGQSGTCGYASAAKGYLADYVLRNESVTWSPLYFDNSKNDKQHYVDALAESVINKFYSKYDRLIIHSTPDLWEETIQKNKDIDEIIGYCTWETNKLSKSWVDYINLVPEVWVPSNFNKETFINSGVKSKIKVVPHIWHSQKLLKKDNVRIYDYCRNQIPSNKFTFYCIGELNFRKGIEDLVKVFNNVNKKYKDTQLLLKLHYKDYSEQNKKYCISKIQNLTDQLGDSVFLIFDNLTNQEVVAIHSFCDCYVSLNKAEGFGLTIFDAFNYNKKVITTGYGGQVDFLGSDYKGLVDYKIDKVQEMESFNSAYSNDQEWAYPDLDHAYELMIKIYENQL